MSADEEKKARKVPSPRRQRVADARARKAPAKSQAGEVVTRRPSLVQFIRECAAELRKVQWPTRPQLWQATGVVILVSVIFGVYNFILDAGLQRASQWLIDQYASN